MRILVIGANGFLGRNICQVCIENSCEVEGMFHRDKEMIPKQLKIYHINELDTVSKDYDIIFLTVGNFKSPIEELLETNIILSKRVIEKFSNSKIIFISSTAVYGLHKNQIKVSSSFNQPSIYGLSKLAGEFTIQAHKNASIIRLTALYGVGMNNNLFIPKIIKEAKEKKIIRIFGDGERKQDYLFIRDAAILCFNIALYKKVGIFLGAYGKSFSNNQLAKIVASYFPGTNIIHQGKDATPSFTFDISGIKEELGFSPIYTLQEGIKEMIEYYE